MVREYLGLLSLGFIILWIVLMLAMSFRDRFRTTDYAIGSIIIGASLGFCVEMIERGMTA